MMNSDIYSTVLTGHKLIVVVCDNGGFAVINRLQNAKGSPSFNNLIADCRIENQVDGRLREARRSRWARMPRPSTRSATSSRPSPRAKTADRTTVIVIKVQAHQWTPGDAWWDVGVPEVSDAQGSPRRPRRLREGQGEAAGRGVEKRIANSE